MATRNRIGVLVALDVGEKRIGVAISDPLQIVARPLTTIRHTTGEADMSAICHLVKNHQASLIICGYPLSLDDSEGPQGARIRRFSEQLEQKIDTPVKLWDESYSTQKAEMMLKQKVRTNPEQRKKLVDAMAAVVILQSYLDAHSQSTDSPLDGV